MTTLATEGTSTKRSLPKAPTGIQGLDELTRGGLPRGRPTLLCGSAGCGRSIRDLISRSVAAITRKSAATSMLKDCISSRYERYCDVMEAIGMS